MSSSNGHIELAQPYHAVPEHQRPETRHNQLQQAETDAWTRLNEFSLRSPRCNFGLCGGCPPSPDEASTFVRVVCSVLQLSIVIVTLACAGLTFYRVPSLRTSNTLLFWYMILTLIGEVFLLACAGMVLLGLRLCVGPYNVNHASAMCAVQMRCCEGILYYISLFLGVCLLVRSIPIQKTGVPISAIVFVLLESCLSLIYVLRSCPVVMGVMSYMAHKIQHKVTRHPIVEFQVPYERERGTVPTYAVVAANEYTTHVATISNPTMHSWQHTKRSSHSPRRMNEHVMSEPTKHTSTNAREEQKMLLSSR